MQQAAPAEGHRQLVHGQASKKLLPAARAGLSEVASERERARAREGGGGGGRGRAAPPCGARLRGPGRPIRGSERARVRDRESERYIDRSRERERERERERKREREREERANRSSLRRAFALSLSPPPSLSSVHAASAVARADPPFPIALHLCEPAPSTTCASGTSRRCAN